MRRLLSLVASLLIPAAALAQVDRATLSGVVHHASGAVEGSRPPSDGD